MMATQSPSPPGAGPLGQVLLKRITRGQLLAGGAATAAVSVAALGARAAHAADAPAGGQTFSLDVSCDGRTFRYENGASGPAVRGSTFIVSGKLFPAGTFGSNPERFEPDSPGSIGAWICAGTFQYDLAEIAKGKAPHVISTQYYLLDDGSVLMSEGLEGGMTTLRVILGGAGKYAGARGTVVEKHGVSDNNTLIRLGPGVELPAPNIVFGFNLV
jgi:hypothetical protein